MIAAAQALIDIEGINAEDIAKKSMKIAGDLCIYTNHHTMIELIPNNQGESSEASINGRDSEALM